MFHFRVIKTVIACFLALVIADRLGIDYPLFTALACAFCIRQTFYGSLRRFLSEVRITVFATGISLLGGAFVEVAIAHWGENFVLEYGVAALMMGLVVIVVQYFHWSDVLSIGLLTVLYIFLVPATEMYVDQFLARGVARFGSILIGAVVALTIDFIFSGFEYSNLFHRRIRQGLNSIESMLESFVEAILLEDQKRTENILDQSVDSLGTLAYVSEKLNDLEKEMDFRGGSIHGFTLDQVHVMNQLIQDLRLISFQLESASINYLRLLEKTNGKAESMPGSDYERFSAKGRELSRSLRTLHEAVINENPGLLKEIPRPDSEREYEDWLDDLSLGKHIKLLEMETLASIDRIEFYLGRVADTFEKYYALRNPD